MLSRLLNFIKFCIARFEKRNRILFFSVAVSSLLMLISAVVIPVLQKEIISEAGEGKLNVVAVNLMLAVSLLNIACALFETTVINRLNITLQNSLHKELMQNALRQGSRTISQRGSGAFMSSMLGDSERLSGLIKANNFAFFLMIGSCTVTIAITANWSWIFAIVVAPIYLLTVIIIVISNRVYTKHFALAREGVMTTNPRILERLENRLSVLGYADVMKLETDLFGEFDKRDYHFRKANMANALSKTAIRALEALGLAALFILSINRINSGALAIPTFIALLSYYFGIFTPITAAQELSQGMKSFSLHHDRIKPDLDYIPSYGLPKSMNLSIRKCSFTYGEGNSGRIKDLSVEIDKKIGLVGLSGEGKTTIIKILMGSLVPQGGSCLLGGVAVTEVSKALLHSSIRLYSQDTELFNDTLEFNIALGKTPLSQKNYECAILEYQKKISNCRDNPKNNCEILKELFLLSDKALRCQNTIKSINEELSSCHKSIIMSYAEALVSRKYYLIEKFDAITTELGIAHLSGRTLGQHGTKVSGGEKNKICLARFLLPCFKGFCIIDEPLTSVDAISEEVCINAISKYLDCNGAVIISHKLNMIRALSDEIIVLDNGTISERGTHENLFNNHGLYTKLYTKFADLK